jgi:superfamily II DNA or RNA helicase
MDTPERDIILKAITEEEKQLVKFEHERNQALSRINTLKQKLASLNVAVTSQLQEPPILYSKANIAPVTSTEKVKLYHSLFRGREDVYPKLWTSRSGRKGYSPACSNEWVNTLCGKTFKPPVKCSDCLNRALLPVTDQAILDHLQGRHVMGVYPMLENDTCWFLAVDFDKQTWMDDIGAFRETCVKAGIPVYIERSRSGNGAHAWFFFAEPITASTARTFGCYFITETMSNRHQLSMESYDRLFPSQDTLPKGGFGNLIAMPLQHNPRQNGNTLFVDENFAPFEDQWVFLSSMQRIAPETVWKIANEAIQHNNVIGVPRGITDERFDKTPWMLQPSGRLPVEKIIGVLPNKVRVILSQRIYVEKKGLPSPLLNRIKRLAAFQNPEFYKKQSLRLSTALTPRVITCFEELPEHISIPRGCLEDIKKLFVEHNITLEIDDKRHIGERCLFTFQGELRELQTKAIETILQYDNGVLVAPPGFGKTVLGACLVAERQCNTLLLVHRKPLLEQWTTQLSHFLNIDPKAIGKIGGGKNQPNGRLDIAMIQSLVRKGAVSDLVAQYGQVIIDECHHLPAVSFERVLNEVKARFVIGLTATPYRRDGHQPIIHMQCGPVRFSVHPKSDQSRSDFKCKLLCRTTDFEIGTPDISIQDIFASLVTDQRRNELILTDIRQALKEKRSPLLLTERKEHLDILVDKLRNDVQHLIVLDGRMSVKERRETMKRLEMIPEEEERLIAATGRYIGEGFDDARLDTLFLAMPFSWKGTIVQYAGRLHRGHPGKQEVRVYDYVDAKVLKLARMHKKRLKEFQIIGYTID